MGDEVGGGGEIPAYAGMTWGGIPAYAGMTVKG